MACSDVFGTGESLEIIRVTSSDKNGEIIHELELIEENLEKIMCHPEVKENHVQIVSIAGAFRKGKSFLLGFFLKYLQMDTQLKECDWLSKNDKIEGFEWRGGSKRVTSGIQIWSKPFVSENKLGEKVAVLLMDTQGVFDEESTVEDCASIFALSSLISSVQIYNLKQQLQEDDLQHLEFFTEFGKLVSEQAHETDTSNSRLIFLIRDWSCPSDYSYGKVGGEAYIREILKIKPNHHKETKRIRRNLNECFPNIGGFLLPYPGKAVATEQTFDGLVKEMDDDFVKMAKLLVPYILSRDMMVTKRINGMEVTGKEMSNYVRTFVRLLKISEFPSPQTAFKAIAAVGRLQAINAAFEFYKEEMGKVCNLADGKSLTETELENHSKNIEEQAREKLKKTPRMQIPEHEFECLEQLNSLMEQKYEDLKEIMKKQNENLLLQKLANTATTTKDILKAAATGVGYAIGTVGTVGGMLLGAIFALRK